MPDKHYDVVVIGRSVGALVSAALLARRDFRVLLIGQRGEPAAYRFEEHALRRRSFAMLSAASPVWRRVTQELAQSQRWRRRAVQINPMLQVVTGSRRFDVPPDTALFAKEVEREYPAVKRHLAELYNDFARVTAAADQAFAHESIWPPGTFFERRGTGRIASSLPYARAEPHADLLAEFPRNHEYRRIVHESARLASHWAGHLPAFAVARLHGAWTRGVQHLPGGEDELTEMLLERTVANGGAHLLQESVARIDVRRGAVVGIQLDGESQSIGAGSIITDLSGEELVGLAHGQGISKKAQRDWPRLTATTGRFVVSLVVRNEGVPEPLGREVLLLGSSGSGARDTPTIWLQTVVDAAKETTLLVAEVLLSERGSMPVQHLRQHVVDRLAQALPYLHRHLLVVDSVHDGKPLWFYGDASRVRPIERAQVSGASSRPEPMVRQFEVDPPGYLGIAGEPLRGPIERSLLVGPGVLPALGQEGEILAATSAARLITKADKRKARIRREMWTKLEIT